MFLSLRALNGTRLENDDIEYFSVHRTKSDRRAFVHRKNEQQCIVMIHNNRVY